MALLLAAKAGRLAVVAKVERPAVKWVAWVVKAVWVAKAANSYAPHFDLNLARVDPFLIVPLLVLPHPPLSNRSLANLILLDSVALARAAWSKEIHSNVYPGVDTGGTGHRQVSNLWATLGKLAGATPIQVGTTKVDFDMFGAEGPGRIAPGPLTELTK